MSTRTRDYCYTLNNYTPAEYESFKLITCSYHVIGKEVGANGTPHLQGYIYFAQPKGNVAVRTLLPRAHVEARLRASSCFQALTYCKKDGDFWEIGVVPLSSQEKGAKEMYIFINLVPDGNMFYLSLKQDE